VVDHPALELKPRSSRVTEVVTMSVGIAADTMLVVGHGRIEANGRTEQSVQGHFPVPLTSSRPDLIRMLVVEDDATHRALLLAYLAENAKWSAHGVATVVDALTALRTERFDCLLVDLALPVGRGLGVVAGLTELPNAAVVVVSGDESRQALLHASRAAPMTSCSSTT
jgi:CheY-like chemotaxis protein